jgi:hypothetical protein
MRMAMPFLLLFHLGCQTAETTVETEERPEVTLRVLVIDDEPLAKAIEQAWESRYESPLDVKRIAAERVADAKRLGADVVVYPSAVMGLLASRQLIVPLPREVLAAKDFNRRDLFLLQRTRETTWGTEEFAVPLGSPQLMLLYRRDIFEKLELQPPADWQEYQQVIDKLSDPAVLGDLPVDEAHWSATREPTGEGWGGKMLLARAASYVTHRNQYSDVFRQDLMAALISTEPYLRAVNEMRQALTTHAAVVDPRAALEDLARGRCAMAITWPMKDVNLPDDLKALPIDVTELPGSSQVYSYRQQEWQTREPGEPTQVALLAISGRVASITDEANSPNDASEFLSRLGGVEWGLEVSPQSAHTNLFRTSQLEDIESWVDVESVGYDMENLRQTLVQTQGRYTGVLCCRIPGHAQYLKALDTAVTAVLEGETPAAAALQQAADAWDGLTEALGEAEQKAAYARSLGL